MRLKRNPVYICSQGACLLAKALWFGICWGAHDDELSLNSIKDSPSVTSAGFKKRFHSDGNLSYEDSVET